MNLKTFFRSISLSLLLYPPFSAAAQHRTITGMVTESGSDIPVPSASIRLLQTSLGTSADAGGAFRLEIPDDTSGRIIISAVGFASDTVSLSGSQSAYRIGLHFSKGILDEVVVTGATKSGLARENPIPIVAVSSKAIARASETNIIDALVKNVPGLNAVKTGPNISKPFIRGLGYNRVLTLYDGMRQEGQQWGDEHGIEVDACNIDCGEVIKGPASLLYGSDAVAGVVSLLPYMPDQTDGKIRGRFLSEYQSNDGLTGNGLRLTYADNHWAYALRGSYRIAKNYTNAIDGRVYNTGFRESNASAGIRYTGKRGYSDLNTTLYDNGQGIPDGSRDSLSRRFTKQVYEGGRDTLASRPLVSDAELNGYTLSPLYQHIQHYRVYSNSHFDLDKGDIDVLLGVQQNIRREYSHPTAPQQAGLFVRLNTLNYGVRYNAPKILNTELTIGANGMYQANKNKAATDFPIPDYTLFDAGGFLYAKWKQKAWTVSGGIRYDIRSLKGDDFYVRTNGATGFSEHASIRDTAGSQLQFAGFSKPFSGVSLSIGATFQVGEHLSLKTNVARGYRAPSITEFASNGLDPGAHIIYLGNRDFVPEFSFQEDISGDLHYRDISASVSLFNNNIAHYIYLSQVIDVNGMPLLDAQGNKTFQYEQSAAQLYGFEATLSVHPAAFKGFFFDNAFSAIHGYNRAQAFNHEATQGEYLPLIPPARLLSSLGQEFRPGIKLISSITLKAELDYNAAQNRYLALNNTETQTPGFTLFNFGWNAEFSYAKHKALQLQVQLNNVFDKTYQSNLSRLKYFECYAVSPDGHSGIYSMGRNLCLKMIAPF